MLIFKDRQAAGLLLGKRLTQFKSKRNVVVLGIPRGGVVVASKVAKKLKLPLDIVITRKIGAPDQRELALGAVDPNGNVIWDTALLNSLGIKVTDLSYEITEQIEEIKRREKTYRGKKEALGIKGKTVILVDDGIATGATLISAIKYLKSLKAKEIIVAVPVAASEITEKIKNLADEVIVLHIPEYLGAVGNFYQNFSPVSDKEVIDLLQT